MTEITKEQPRPLELTVNAEDPQSWLAILGLQQNNWEIDSPKPDQGHLFWRNQQYGSLTVDAGEDLTTITSYNPRHPTIHEVNLSLRPTPDGKLTLAGANMRTQLPTDSQFRTFSFVDNKLTQIDPPPSTPLSDISTPDWLQVIKKMFSPTLQGQTL